MKFPRASGILLHPTSLPGRFGIGDLGPSAYEFVDRLAAAGQTYWQILPLNLTDRGGSPYSSVSAFAGNTLLISPERLVEEGLVDAAAIADGPTPTGGKFDFAAIENWKGSLLKRAYKRFRSVRDETWTFDFHKFGRHNGWWLDDVTLFTALKSAYGGRSWAEWDEPLRTRVRGELVRHRLELMSEIAPARFAQFLFFRQWAALKRYANENGIRIIGDIPIFVAHDSADVWCNQKLFKLDDNGMPKVVAGVPPDFFSATGQLWGNPIYDWAAMRRDQFGWWTARLEFTLRVVDVVRLDHFIGFVRNWEVPYGQGTAEKGEWVDVPGYELFATLRARLGDLPVIAEDLGAVTPEVVRLRDENDFPGMRILQNAFGGDAHNRNLPHNYIRRCAAYPGTHDNDTSRGWYKHVSRHVRKHCRKYLASDGRNVAWDMMRAVWASVADIAIAPMQDVLSLDNEARMNTPGTAYGNWQWRMRDGEFSDALVERLREMTVLFGRSPDRG